MAIPRYLPLSRLVDALPGDLSTGGLLDDIIITGFEPVNNGAELSATAHVAFNADLTVSIAGLDGVELVLPGDPGNSIAVAVSLSPTFGLTVSDIIVGLRFQSGLLKPVTGEPGAWVVSEDPLELELDVGVFTLDEEFRPGFTLNNAVSLGSVMIGDTGFIVTADNLVLYLSGRETPPAGRAAGFRGIELRELKVYLPDSFDMPDLAPEEISATGLVIGTGGLSGTFSGSWDVLWDGATPQGSAGGTFLGFSFALTSVSVEIAQNAVVGGAISGQLALPFLDTIVSVQVGMQSDGSFSVTLTGGPDDVGDPENDESGYLATVSKEGIGTFRLRSIGLEHRDAETVIVLGGQVALTVGSPSIQWPVIDFEGLRISSSGAVDIPGGWITLPEPLALDLYGFGMEISQIGFGKEEDDRRWVGLSGGVRLAAGLPCGASVEGLRVIWDPEGETDPELTLNGLGVSLAVPGAFSLSGLVSFVHDDTNSYFSGSVELSLDALGVKVGGGLLIGRNSEGPTPFTYLYLTADVVLPVGIPIGATGAAIYGFGGATGLHVTPKKEADDSWYDWYRGGTPTFSVTDPNKWMGELDAFAIGASMTVGTLPDLAFSVSGKATLMVLLPGPVIMLHGLANLLAGMPDPEVPDSEGTLNLLAVLDAADGYMQLNIDAGYKLAKIVDIAASAEAFFDFARPQDWHLYIGQKDPESARVHADIISLFHADSYYMIESTGLTTGFSVRIGDSWTYTPVSLTLTAWIAAEASLTWSPVQLDGYLGLGGEISLAVAGFSAGISVEAELTGSSPTLYWVRGDLNVTVNLPVPLKDISVDVSMEWKQSGVPEISGPVSNVALEHYRFDGAWPVAVEDSDAAYVPGTTADSANVPVVPLDIHPVILFSHAVVDQTDFTSNPTLDGADRIGEYDFTYELVSVSLARWPHATANPLPEWEDISDRLSGAWAADDAGDSGSRRLQIGAKTPFQFSRNATRTYRDRYLAANLAFPCGYAPDSPELWTDWETVTAGTSYGMVFNRETVVFLGPGCSVVAHANATFGTAHALYFSVNTTGTLWIGPAERSRNVTFYLEITGGPGVLCRAFREGVLLQEKIAAPGVAVTVVMDVTDIDWLSISWSGDATFYLARISRYLEDAQTALDAYNERHERLEDSVKSWSSEEEIFEPETTYRLTVKTRTTREKDGVESGSEDYEHNIFFRTCGPPGIAPTALLPEWAVTDEAWPLSGQPEDLSGYVQWSVPEDGAVASYAAHDLGVQFLETYIEQMYGGQMVIKLLDQSGAPATDESGDEIVFSNSFGRAPIAELASYEYAYLDRLLNCTEASSTGVLSDSTVIVVGSGLLSEDFSDDLDDWQAVAQAGTTGTPAWAIVEGVLTQTVEVSDGDTDPEHIEKLGTLLLGGETDWTDYAVEVTARCDSAAIGVVFRYQDEDNYYRLSLGLSPSWRKLVRVSAGVFEELWSDEGTYTAGSEFTLGVQCIGTRIRAQVDEELLFDLEDDATGAPTAGCVGLYLWRATTAQFSAVLVTARGAASLKTSALYSAQLMGGLVLFSDSFSGAWTGAWAVGGASDATGVGTWGQAVGGGPDGGSGDAARQTGTINSAAGYADATWMEVGLETAWTDLSASCNLMGADGGRVGVMIRKTSDTQYYLADLDLAGGVARIVLRDGSTFTELAETTDLDLAAGDWVALTISAEGAELLLYLGDVVVAQATDATLTAGRVAIACSAETDARFSDVVITRLPFESVHRWSFTTSRFEDWVNHTDSYIGSVYTLTLDAPPTDLSTRLVALKDAHSALRDALEEARTALEDADEGTVSDLRDAVNTALSAWVEGIADEQEGIADESLGLAWRSRPDALEITEIVDGDGVRYAILLESPEPMDLQRLDVHLQVQDAGGVWSDVESLPAWNRDATAVLVFSDSSGLFPAGTYRLRTVYRMDLGDEAPVLRRGGSALAQVADLEFSLA